MINSNYSNNTINPEKISDEVFRFYKSAKSRSDRDGRRLISFNTRNDNIEVHFIVFCHYFFVLDISDSLKK